VEVFHAGLFHSAGQRRSDNEYLAAHEFKWR
jgi:hypothetical protein